MIRIKSKNIFSGKTEAKSCESLKEAMQEARAAGLLPQHTLGEHQPAEAKVSVVEPQTA